MIFFVELVANIVSTKFFILILTHQLNTPDEEKHRITTTRHH